ncbi:MAG TPA: hypothetical protein H9677_05035 [Firmicutes bacterium]|nr:hypothetical protein [Bacillota bacterium]
MKKQRKNVLAALLVTAVMAAGLAFSACAERSDNLEDLVSSVRNMGAPEADAAKGISSDMSAEEMMEVGFYNYYAAPYVVSENYSTNTTTPPGTEIAFNQQYIDGYKIRKGVYSENDPLASQAYHLVISAGAVSGSRRIEEAVVNGGNINYRTVSGNALSFNDDIGMVRVAEGARFEYTDYGTDLERYNTEVCNDPTKVFTYNIYDTAANALVDGCVQSATEPVYDEEEGVYAFSVVFANDVVTQDYLRLLELNLAKQGGGNVRYESLEMDFEMWADGHIKSISILERYNFSMVLSLDNIYDADVYFAYDEEESGYIMADYVNAFTTNKAVERNNELFDYATENADGKVMSAGEIAGTVAGVLALCAVIIAVAAVVAKKVNAKKAAEREAREAAESERELFGVCDDKQE